MDIPRYLAMTAAEFWSAPALTEHVAWMACHFSSYGTGLSNLPTELPPDSMVILNDRIPFLGHDPERILAQMEEIVNSFHPNAILLDLQRPDIPPVANIAKLLAQKLPCPVGITEAYAKDLSCPVFLEAPIDQALEEALSVWKGREIWLDIAPAGGVITVTSDTSEFQPDCLEFGENPVFTDEKLCCRYQTQIGEDFIRFLLRRDPEDMAFLLEVAEKLGVTRAVGLYQQLGTDMEN